jgi:hypothetical protein
MTLQLLSVTTTSSLMRAAEYPSAAGTVGFEREHHASLDFHRPVERNQPRDDWPTPSMALPCGAAMPQLNTIG